MESVVQGKPKIKVIGIGGGGNNAIKNMAAAGIKDVELIAANTTLKKLEQLHGIKILPIGPEETRGLGCGGDPEIGKRAATESIDKILEILENQDLIFVTAGMGGGTGTGAAPIIAEHLKKLATPPLVVGVVTKPFAFEGRKRMSQALQGIENLKDKADTIIEISNDKLLEIAPKGMNITDSFRMSDNLLLEAVQGISHIITSNGLINLDFQDVKAVLWQKGSGIMGSGTGTGENRVIEACKTSLRNPLLENCTIEGAKNILANFWCAQTDLITMEETSLGCEYIRNEVRVDADLFFGVTFNDTLGPNLKVTLIATGLTE